MDKQQYASAPPPGFAPPPAYDGPASDYPPNTYPPQNSSAYPPNNYPSNPPNNYPSNPPNNYPSYPPNNYPSNAQTAYPTQQTASTVVITGGPIVSNFGPNCQQLTCPYCHHFITTKVETKATSKTHLMALISCLCLCWLCCCCPYCIDSCQGRNHYCPQCNAFLGTYTN